ncbi:hypothetical protein Pfo_020548 [Paulownia fortunei]|nr:hypothetical protein Pfo_020548 [Paulownia fortunei]
MAFIIFFFLPCQLLFMAAADLAINCGSTAASTAFDGKEWTGDMASQLKGTSISSSSLQDLTNIDPVPYRSARITRSQFSYVFQVNPGQQFIRLHFNPVLYRGFKKYKDFFTVEASPFTLLGNFSASLTANALGVKYFVKEFFMNVEESQTLTLKFSSEHSESRDTYAFINGIEIIPVPSGLYYTHDGDLGAQVVGQKSRVFIDNSIALEMVHRYLISSIVDSGIRRWAANTNRKSNKIDNFTWKISIDVGFGYLVRLYFGELQLSMAESDGVEFKFLINDKIADTKVVSVQGKSLDQIPQYQDYVVMMKGHKQEGKRDLVIAIQLKGDQLINGPLKGFEIFKISNPDNSLACPNPSPPSQHLSSRTLQKIVILLSFGHGNATVKGAIVMITLLNIVVYKLRQIWEANSAGESNTPSASMEGICRRFSLAEMLSATEEFSGRLVIGRGGFGTVYKGFINKGKDIVAIKRLKSNSKQGAHEFWTEVETLSKIRHVHLVSLVGYCNESQEMILVYEYMPHGTLADHLYKLRGQSDYFTPLSWEQRLRICIGAARGLDYLHMGTAHGIIHRDVKASNILLDEYFVAKISDFGLAKVGKTKLLQSSVSTNVKGTFGYLDPDYFLTRKLRKKTDVYAFGVVLLEVICGRPAVGLGLPENERSLTIWARDYIHKGEIDHIVAPNLRGQISADCLKFFVQISEKCLHNDPRKRPTMAHLVAQLEFALDQHQNTKSLMPREITCANDDLSTDETIHSVSPTQSTMSSKDQPNVSALPKEITKSKSVQNVVVPARGTPDRRKTSSATKPLWVWPWEAFWNRAKTSKSKELLFPDGPCHRFSISDILAATNDFDDNLIITRDDFYIVYNGVIKSFQRKVAIGRVKCALEDKLFDICTEIGMLSQLSHPNLASVIGYCYHSDEMIIVYDYVGNGALCDYLYNNKKVLPWKHRLQICVGVAQGLRHLHIGASETIIHRDVRPDNIFLDMNGAPKLLSFGFHSLSPMADLEGDITTAEYLPRRTQYLAPDFFILGRLTEKSDIYSFGLILLEVICGTRTMNNKIDTRDHYLPNQVKRSIQWKTLHQIIDPYLRDKIAVECLSKYLKVALSCLLDQPTSRPSIDNVVEGLELALAAQETVEAASVKDIECTTLHNGAFDLENVYPKLSSLESKVFSDSGILDQVFDSVATFDYDESLSR